MIEGRFFAAHAARVVAARASVVGRRVLRIEASESGAVLAEAPARQVQISARLARVPRRFEFRDGSCFETDDNDGAEELVRKLRGRLGRSFIDRVERSWRWIAVSILAAVAVAALFVVYGIPAGAAWLAAKTPSRIAVIVSDQTLGLLDGTELGVTTLKKEDQARATTLFTTVAAHEPRGVKGYTLLFRHGGAIGANAFALPDGRVVMTDELWAMVKNDDEIEGVFAHEMAHVNHAHGLQRAYQATLIPVALALLTGDPTQFSQVATVLPGILVESSYSRGFEQQADDDAAATIKRMGGKPSRMADLLERLDKSLCGKHDCPPSWIGTHPDTASRAARLRLEESQK